MPSVLVTGAGRGIGLAITRHMSDRGWDVYPTARSADDLRDLGPDWLAKRNEEAHTRRLVAQLEKLGHTVIIDPAA